jgi:hypothetical protein
VGNPEFKYQYCQKRKKKKGDGDFPKITNHLLVPQAK